MAYYFTTHHQQNKGLIPSVLVSLMLGFMLLSCSSAALSFKTLTAEESKNFLAQTPSAVILDVRTPAEYSSETGHLSKAVLIPVQELEQRLSELSAYKKQPILVYCRSGARSKTASTLLSAQGFSVINMDGGIMAWNAANYPIER